MGMQSFSHNVEVLDPPLSDAMGHADALVFPLAMVTSMEPQIRAAMEQRLDSEHPKKSVHNPLTRGAKQPSWSSRAFS